MKKINGQMAATAVAQCAVFVVLMMLTGVVIKIPFPFVPLTFQTAVCIMAGLLLGWKKGLYAMAAYIVLGLVGLPVFSAGGGIFYVLKPSFGYVIGFAAGAAVAGLVRGKKITAPLWRYVLGALAGFAVNYAIGIAYFIIVWLANGWADLGGAIISYNLIYMPKDVVLSFGAAILSCKLTPFVLQKYKNFSV